MLSKEFLTERGYCCGHGCLMCPYEPKHTEGVTNLMGYNNVKNTTLIVSALEMETQRLAPQTNQNLRNYNKYHQQASKTNGNTTIGTTSQSKPKKIHHISPKSF